MIQLAFELSTKPPDHAKDGQRCAGAKDFNPEIVGYLPFDRCVRLVDEQAREATKAASPRVRLDPCMDPRAVVPYERVLTNVANPRVREEQCGARILKDSGIDLLGNTRQRGDEQKLQTYGHSVIYDAPAKKVSGNEARCTPGSVSGPTGRETTSSTSRFPRHYTTSSRGPCGAISPTSFSLDVEQPVKTLLTSRNSQNAFGIL